MVPVNVAPSISQVVPQTIAAGSKNLTIKVSGSHFTSESVILWNGSALSTSVIDSNTLSSPLASNIVATPSTVELQVQNTVTKASSSSVPVVITTPATGASASTLTLSTTSIPQAALGTLYSVALTANGGTPAYTWSVTGGQLPSGLSLSSTGVISGVPTASGSFSFAITVTDSGSPAQTAAMQFGLNIPAAAAPPVSPTPLQITPSLPAGAVGSIYSGSLQVSGGTAPYTWSSSALPTGLSLAGNGAISGDPTSSGSTTVTFTVADSSSPALTASVTAILAVTPSPLTITIVSLPAAQTNSPYSASLQVHGGTAPYTWSTSALPAGLTLTNNGTISGTPTASGNFPITVTVTDAGSPTLTTKASFTLSVAETVQPLVITSTSLAPATSSKPYSASLDASGGTAPYSWSAGALPAGLTLTNNGILSGTPTATGVFTVTVTVTDAGSPSLSAKTSFSLSVAAAILPLNVTSVTLAGATSNQPYSASLNASGGTAPYTWSASALPAGLIFASDGILSGTPNVTGSFPVTFTVTDAGTPALTAKATLNISVTADIQPLTITSTSVASATSNKPYSASLDASGGTAPYTWSSTALPAGLSLRSNGILSGTPTATGSFPITFTVTDAGSPALTAKTTLSISVTAAIQPLTISSTPFAGATANQPYSASLNASGGTAPYIWSAAGLPAGLSLASNGILSGTPTATGNFPITVNVTDSSAPAVTAKATFSLSVTAPIQPLTITSTAIASATSSQPYTASLNASGGTAPYTWSAAGLPAGLSFASNGIVAGTPTATGSFPITFTVTDAGSPTLTTKATLTLSVAAAIQPLSITSSAFASATANQPYSASLNATGGTPPYTWSGAGLPAGVSLATNGILSGTPTVSGNFPITLAVTDAGSPTLTTKATISLSVAAAIAPLSITSTTFAGATSTQPYTTTLSATGGTAPYTWSVTGLPAGLTLGGNGVIAGTPTATGSFPIAIAITDAGSPTLTAKATISLSVVAPIAPLAITTTTFAGATSTQPYSATLSATGGTAPYTWSVTGLPAGLTLGSNGVIAGTPTATGNFSISVTVTDSQSPAKTASATIPLSVTAAIAPLAITTTTFAGATSTQPYTTTLSATGGTAPYTWSVTGLPAGLTLGSNGVIAGTPTATGSFPISVTVTDSQSPAKTASATIPLAVTAAIAPLSITSTTFAGATSTQPYTTTLSATGGTAPYTWSVTGLPAGLALGSNGVIAGTPTATGTFSISITVTDSQSPAKTASATISLSVTAAIAPLAITSTTFTGATSNQPYTTTLSATGGTAPYTWSVTGLPAGLALGNNGVIAGTPTATGSFSISVTVTDSQSPAKTASATISLAVTAAIAPLTITTTTFAGATSTQPYTTTLSATGGTAPYTWSVTGLPAGLTLGSNGVIAGTPTATGSFPISVIVTDSQSPAKTASATIPLAVTAAIAPLAITTTTFAGATSTQPYTTTLSATGGTAPYTWSVTGLPAGLTLGSNGVIAGTPTATGNFSISVTVTDSQSPAKTASATISLAVTAAIAPLSITSTTFAGATSTQPYTTTLSATGGTAPYTWSVTGLPAGLTLGSNGVIAGTPTATGNFSISVTVTDSQSPAKTASATISLAVTAAIAPLSITSTTFAGATSTQPYTTTLSATGGTAPYTWSVTGLPAGLALGSNGVIAGTPTATGNFSISVTVTDSQSPAKTASATISLAVTATPLTITTSTLPSGTESTAYSSTLQASGGTPAYTWSISTGSLPAGLTLAATTGVISGTPSVTGTSSFTATVSDNGTPVQTKSVTVSITLSAAQPPPGPGTTWYIRPDGGTNTQCTGKTNAAYPGSGSGQACAFNHPYQMMNSSGAWTSFAGGDTIQFVNTSGTSDTYYMGEQNAGIGTDWHSQLSVICPQPNANQSQGFECVLPVPPRAQPGNTPGFSVRTQATATTPHTLT
ncbi:putative Ig domain-containing protein [Tunturibacter empetritectus]|uniref:Ig domain-containing protein n=1 Tax=Tunturiibacter empetritectus TaxID=3069691 RepID=A0AAU7ZFY3_9BACT